MPRRRRIDRPGLGQHAMNRGVAKRVVFETRADVRQFLSLVARAVRRGDLEVEAFSILPTHFHLLVRSPKGRLSEAMRRIENGYVRYFNRARKRDGALFRGRFASKPVGSETYRSNLVSYLDANPVLAAISSHPDLYPYGSAWHYARRSKPRWLSRGWVESEVRNHTGADNYDPADYHRRFPIRVEPEFAEWVERRMRESEKSDEEFENLVRGAPEVVRRWMVRKARLADGIAPGAPIVPAKTLLASFTESASVSPFSRPGGSEGGNGAADRVALAGLLRQFCGLSFPQLARLLRCAPTTARDRCARHCERLVRDRAYGVLCSLIVRRTMAAAKLSPD